MNRFLKVKDIGLVNIDKIEALDAVVRVNETIKGRISVIAVITVVMESGDFYKVLELRRERLITEKAGEKWERKLAPIPLVKSELCNTITHIAEDIAHGNAMVVEVRALDSVTIEEALVKAAEPTKAARHE